MHDSRTNLFDNGGNDIELWCNHALERDQGVKKDIKTLVLKSNVPRDPYRAQNEEIT